jgi:hypothetical protein
MATDELSAEVKQGLEQSRYLVAYLAKLYHEQSGESLTVQVTVREDSTSGFVIEVDGHEVKFGA